jgi:hypothetical protein
MEQENAIFFVTGNASHKSNKVKKKHGVHGNRVQKNIPRSTLIGIKPEELAEPPTQTPEGKQV